jgi:hypothetical protein
MARYVRVAVGGCYFVSQHFLCSQALSAWHATLHSAQALCEATQCAAAAAFPGAAWQGKVMLRVAIGSGCVGLDGAVCSQTLPAWHATLHSASP